jgi:predicted dehydrogenase
MILVEGFYRAQPCIEAHGVAREWRDRAGADDGPRSLQLVDAANIRFDPAHGGALLDAGTYPVSLSDGFRSAGQSCMRWLIGARSDRTLVATLEHPGGLLAQISCSFTTCLHRHALIAGTSGVIQTTYLNNPPLDRPAVLQLRRSASSQEVDESVEVRACNGFQAEAESFERLVRLGWKHWTGATPVESVDIAMALDAIIASARSRRPVDIAA